MARQAPILAALVAIAAAAPAAVVPVPSPRLLLATAAWAATPATALSLPAWAPSFLTRRPEGAALIDWVRTNGGVAHVRVAAVPGGGGLRGLVVERALARGDVVMALPSNLSIPMGDNSATSPESAVLLLGRRVADPAWWASLDVYLRSLPAAPFTKETMTREEAGLLQDSRLTTAVHDEIEWARAVFEGRRTEEVKGPTLASALSGHNVTWPEFQRWVSIIASYTFHLPDDAGVTRAVFLPLLDLINHGDKGDANADVDREGGSFVIRATRDIKPGDEVTFTYSPGQARPDHTFMHYGFLNRVRRERPHLACIDLANRTLWDCPGPDAAELGLEETPINTTEAERLDLILRSFPTTEADDYAALKAIDRKTKWREALILEFRATRKRALRHAINRFSGVPAAEVDRSEL